jgi:hypothetical protein
MIWFVHLVSRGLDAGCMTRDVKTSSSEGKVLQSSQFDPVARFTKEKPELR